MISRESAKKFRKFIEEMSKNATDEEAIDNKEAFPRWETDRIYFIDDRVRYNDQLYRVLQQHRSQSDWTPDIAVSLYSQIK